MGFFSRLIDSITVNGCSPEQLVELMAPLKYYGTEMTRKAERRFVRLPTEVQARALLKGLLNKEEYVRVVCAERLASFVGCSLEITDALLKALQDPSDEVRFHAARYFDIGVLRTVSLYRKLPFSLSSVLRQIEDAEKERDR